MALIFRGQLNRPLTSAEIDANFAYFTGSQSITGSLTVSGSIIPTVGTGEVTSSFSLGSETAAWKDIYVSNGSIKFVSGTPGNIQTSSLSVGASGGIQVSTDFLPPAGNYDLTLGSTDQFWKSLYVGTGSVNFTTQVNNTGLVIASIKAIGEFGVPGSTVNSGQVYIETTSTKRGSFSVGISNSARGTGSFAQGNGNTITGNWSHAQGEKTLASGESAHSEGGNTIASGKWSHAEGYATTAAGLASHAEGLSTIASGSYQTVIGQFNVASTSASAFIIGDGASISRHNLLFASKSYFEVSASNAFFKGLAVSASGYVVNINPTTGKLSYSALSGSGGAGTPGGNNTNIQYNNSGIFAGSDNFNYNSSIDDVSVTGSVTIDGTFNTPQIVNYNIDVPIGTNAMLMGPTVALANEAAVQNGSFLTIVGDIVTPQALQSQTLQVNQGTALNGSLTLNLNEIPDAPNDPAAALAGVNVGGVYRNGNVLHIRII